MIKHAIKFCVILSCIFGLEKISANETDSFFLERQDGTILEGYCSFPSTNCQPIIFAIQGSSCESTLKWHMNLCDPASSIGFGVITLEK